MSNVISNISKGLVPEQIQQMSEEINKVNPEDIDPVPYFKFWNWLLDDLTKYLGETNDENLVILEEFNKVNGKTDTIKDIKVKHMVNSALVEFTRTVHLINSPRLSNALDCMAAIEESNPGKVHFDDCHGILFRGESDIVIAKYNCLIFQHPFYSIIEPSMKTKIEKTIKHHYPSVLKVNSTPNVSI
jgi:hypothetical protein